MKTIELFCGTKSFSKVAASLGHDTFTVDNDIRFKPDLCTDILTHDFTDFYNEFYNFNCLWASPPCTAFSIASVSNHWKKTSGGYSPKSDSARRGLALLDKTLSIIANIRPDYWYIENPRGMMRKIIEPMFRQHCITKYRRVTVTYCQYGDTRMNPTDIWTNDMTWKPRPICKNGDPCHERAPRGSKTGNQGLKDAAARSVIPPALFKEIFDVI